MEINEILGRKLYDEYEYIRPCLYLMKSTYEKGFSVHRWIDEGKRVKGCKGIVVSLLRIITYGFSYLTTSKNIEPGSSLLSSGLLMSNRYEAVMRKILDERTVGEITVATSNPLKFGVKNNLNRKRRLKRRVFLGKTVASKATIAAYIDCYNHLVKLFELQETALLENDVITKALDHLCICVRRDVKKIKKKLDGKGIRSYIIIQQRRLKEIIMVTACRELGIKTSILSHHNYYLNGLPENLSFFTYVDRICFWEKNDEMWFERYISRSNVLQTYEVCVTGTPEIEYDEYKNNMIIYKKQEIAMLLMPGSITIDMGYYSADGFYRDLFRIFAQWGKLNHFKLRIKFHPSDKNLLKNDTLLLYLKELNIEVLEQTHDALIKSICESKVCFAGESSSLAIANAYGCQCFLINLHRKRHDFCGKTDIQVVDIENLEELRVSKQSVVEKGTSMCLDIKKLLYG